MTARRPHPPRPPQRPRADRTDAPRSRDPRSSDPRSTPRSRDPRSSDPRSTPRSRDPRSSDPRSTPRQGQQVARREAELTFGLRAGLALFDKRPADILRVAYATQLRGQLEALIAHCRSRHLPCDAKPDDELERIAHAPLHEGLVIQAKARSWVQPTAFGEQLVAHRGLAIALDRVRNPYNLGAILRSAAFFGVDGVLFGALAQGPDLPAGAVRVAEGGVEHVTLSRTTDLRATLERYRAHGVQIVGTDGASPTPFHRVAFQRPCIVVMGHEREGLAPRVRAICDHLVSIPGTGAVESLNVAVAAGIVIASAARR